MKAWRVGNENEPLYFQHVRTSAYQLSGAAGYPLGVEGYEHAEWILADYGDFIVPIF